VGQVTRNQADQVANGSDYNKLAVLYVDDEEKSLKYFRLLCADQFRVLTASSAREGLRLILEHQDSLGVVMVHQSLRGDSGVWLLERVRERRPAIARLLLSDGCNWQQDMAAVQSSLAKRIIVTPWDPYEVRATIRTELEIFALQREKEQLLSDMRILLQDRIAGLRMLSAGLNSELRELLQTPKLFVEMLPRNLQSWETNASKLPDREDWEGLYANVKAEFHRMDQLLTALRMAAEDPPPGVPERAKLREVIERELKHLQPELEARQITVEDAVSDDLPDLTVLPERLQRLFELLLRQKIARLSPRASVQIQGRLLETDTHLRDQIEITVADNARRCVDAGQFCRGVMDREHRLNRTLSSIIVYRQGGTLETVKEADKGTTFIIRLPVIPRVP
jgi:signal transduction histidine kinase